MGITVRKRNVASADAWSDTDSLISDSYAIDLDTDNSAATAPELDPSTITVLDRLHDGGSHLIRLAICMDLETQWVGLTFGTHRPANYNRLNWTATYQTCNDCLNCE